MKLIGRLGMVLLMSAALGRAVTLEDVAADPKLWPVEVTVTATTKATVIKNGQPAGMMLVGGGKKLTVSGLAADGITGKLGGTTVRVPVEKTDLLARLDPAFAPAAPVEEAAAEAPADTGAPSVMQRRLSGKLVKFAGGNYQPVKDEQLAGVKYYAIYYSASWCGPCRQFTPGFISTYNQIKRKYPQFEVVFISDDRSANDMREYMKADNMPWPALKYDVRQHNPDLMKYRGPGIPCLVLVDGTGRVLADSFQGDNYLGPGQVLQKAIRILESGG